MTPYYAALLRDPNATVRQLAVAGLQRIDDVRALPALIAALRDTDETVRVGVIQALGNLGDRRAIAPLEAAWKDGNQDALEALFQLADPHLAELLLQMPDDAATRYERVCFIGRIGELAAQGYIHLDAPTTSHLVDCLFAAPKNPGDEGADDMAVCNMRSFTDPRIFPRCSVYSMTRNINITRNSHWARCTTQRSRSYSWNSSANNSTYLTHNTTISSRPLASLSTSLTMRRQKDSCGRWPRHSRN